MRHLTRFLLLRLLLVAVLFNTAIGWPAHATEHLREAQARAVDAGQPAEDAEAHAACAWCSSYAQLEQALDAAAPPPRPPATVADHAVAWRGVDPAPGADRWPFRPRDPPQA